MIYKRPYRICNKVTSPRYMFEHLRLKVSGINGTFKELPEWYELRIWIPARYECVDSVTICDHILCIELKFKASSSKNLHYGMVLPANVKECSIKAYKRPYGVKIVMPKAELTCKVVNVPIL